MEKCTEIHLSSSLEDYLETIRSLEKLNRLARVKDIARRLNVKMPSVTGALKTLKSKGLVNYKKNSYISLTDKGLEIADSIDMKHKLLVQFLEKVLLLTDDKAQETACQMEHTIDCDTVLRIKRLMERFKDEFESSEWGAMMAGDNGEKKL